MVANLRLLVDEKSIPEVGVSKKAAAWNWTAGSCLAGQEHPEAEWREALEEVELDSVHTYIYIFQLTGYLRGCNGRASTPNFMSGRAKGLTHAQ